MKKLILAFVLAFFIIILFFENLSGETSDIMVSNPNTQYMFLNAEEAVPILGNNDDYVMSLSPFDRASRVKSNSEVSTDAYLSYVFSQTLNWNQLEMIRLNNIMSCSIYTAGIIWMSGRACII
jgi:hypothetical protein